MSYIQGLSAPEQIKGPHFSFKVKGIPLKKEEYLKLSTVTLNPLCNYYDMKVAQMQ